MFFVPKRKLLYTEIFASQKSVKWVTKPSFIQSKQILGSITPNVFLRIKIVRQLHLLFSFWQTNFVNSDSMSFFYAVRFGKVVCFKYRWIWVFRHLYVFKQGFCSWHFLVANGLRLDFAMTSWEVYSLKHNVSSFYHLQTLFVDKSSVR